MYDLKNHLRKASDPDDFSDEDDYEHYVEYDLVESSPSSTMAVAVVSLFVNISNTTRPGVPRFASSSFRVEPKRLYLLPLVLLLVLCLSRTKQWQ